MSKRLATLVGCNYPNSKNELHGCVNDVLAMHDLLVSRFGFKADDIQLLLDAPGPRPAWAASAPASVMALKPTGANIRGALNRMVDKAGPGDILFFHYSGHGTLIPSTKPRPHGRPTVPWHDDEAIIPCDFNLITDIDFRHLVDRIPACATLTIVSDSCHSGGLIDHEKQQIGPRRRRRRIIPFPSLLSHLASLSGTLSPDVADHMLRLFGPDASKRFTGAPPPPHNKAKPDPGILLSGCQSDETSTDVAGKEMAYGAFSDSLQRVLRAEAGPLTNRELVGRARKMLRSQGFDQHPCLYCSDSNADAAFLAHTNLKKKEDHHAL